VVCGTGEPPLELRRTLERHSFCSLRVGLSDFELARQFAAAKLFVLATRMRRGRRASGEGYGMVLQEAQLAGVPVVAPAYGGSHEAFVDGLTGAAPVDESVGALGKTLAGLLGNAKTLDQMSRKAAEVADQRLNPRRYARLVVDRLL